MSSQPNTSAVARDPQWLAHRYDARGDTVHFMRLSRADHAACTFVTDAYLPAGKPRLVLRRADAMAVAPPPSRLHFIVHSAFCCSTLLARAMDCEGVATTLKEPVLLNDMISARRQGITGSRLTALLGDATALLARPFEPGESVIVKPSNIVNGLTPALLAMHGESQALLLHAPLRVFLASVARKGMWGRLWARELFAGLLSEGLVDMGFEAGDYLMHTDLQIAAVGWLAQQALFARLRLRFGLRVRGLDSELLMQRPADAMAAIGAHFNLDLDIDAVLAGPAFRTNSKTGDAFGAPDRERDIRQGRALHTDEIEKVSIWAEAVARNAGIVMSLPAPLLD